MSDGHTISLPKCEPRCDLSTVASRDLVMGVCPKCLHMIHGDDARRVLAARRITAERLMRGSA